MENFWDNIKTAALNVWQTIKGTATEVYDRVEPQVAADLKTVFDQLFPVALDLVAAFATSAFDHLTGAQKGAIVDASLIATAKAQSLTLLEADAPMLRQLAYRAVGVTAPADAAPTKAPGA